MRARAVLALAVSLSLAPVVGTAACSTTRPAYADGSPAAPPSSYDPYYAPLSPYGDWWWSGRYGWVWSPYTAPGFGPYAGTFGAGPFGPSTFNRGRWFFVDGPGWTWIPGPALAPRRPVPRVLHSPERAPDVRRERAPDVVKRPTERPRVERDRMADRQRLLERERATERVRRERIRAPGPEARRPAAPERERAPRRGPPPRPRP